MFFLYNLLISFFLLISPIIFIFRICLGKEDFERINEKFTLYKKTNSSEINIWFHGASVGEINSILPIVKSLERRNDIKRILLTSTTLSSAYVVSKSNLKKTKHIYFPIDFNFFSKRFVNFWKPNIAIFVDSEIWPNMIRSLKNSKIPIILINARITEKSFKRWRIINNFSNEIFKNIDLALPQNKQTSKYLKLLGVKKIINAGNLKYFGEKNIRVNNFLKNKFKKKLIICGSSTHQSEEYLIVNLHKKLKLKHKNLITVLIPRHINRTKTIANELEGINLNIILHSSKKKIKKNTDIYIVDTYGETIQFFSLSKLTIVGGSFIKHGGQNPLEPARMGNFILHGPNIENFKEIYDFLGKLKISNKTDNIEEMKKLINSKLKLKYSKKIQKKLEIQGNRILKENLNELCKYI